ncbi:hypothetical protein CBS101457_004500 [Exobasidium rhododendri]|nr:hypothetical protein CBS101457_004500 [Exobasidium rhododendri]
MIIRIAERRRCPLGLINRARWLSTSLSRSINERNIFVESKEEEEAEEAAKKKIMETQRQQVAQQYPVWDGDERLQDTILRMVMDTHQPLRIRGGGNIGQHPADVKMSTIQKPSVISSPSSSKSSSAANRPHDERIITSGMPSSLHLDDRNLAKTPDQKPWAAVYVNPMRREEGGEESIPSVHYGKYLGLPRSSSSRILPKTASGRERLKLAGIKPSSLPFDDRNKMKAIREGIRRWDRAGRMRGVKEEANQYRRSRELERREEEDPISEQDLEAYMQENGILEESEEVDFIPSTSDSAPGETVIGMSGGRDFTSVANERIEAAMKTDFFRRNSLRGKPIAKDVHALNPFLGGEERIMNRLIQKQGAAPPWVELNSQLEMETSDWRSRLIDNWSRRASRMILSSSFLRRGLEPIPRSIATTLEDLQRAPLSAGQQKMLTLVHQYRDAEWEARERDYHEACLKEVNNVIRRYNIVAPTSVRKGLLLRERELQRAFESAKIRLINRLSQELQPSSSSPTFNVFSENKATISGSASTATAGKAEFAPSESSRMGAGLAMGGRGDDDTHVSNGDPQHTSHGRRSSRSATSYTFIVTSFLKRITQQIARR